MNPPRGCLEAVHKLLRIPVAGVSPPLKHEVIGIGARRGCLSPTRTPAVALVVLLWIDEPFPGGLHHLPRCAPRSLHVHENGDECIHQLSCGTPVAARSAVVDPHIPNQRQPTVRPLPTGAASPQPGLVGLLHEELALDLPLCLAGGPDDLNVSHPSVGCRNPPVRCWHAPRRLQPLIVSQVLELTNETNSEQLFNRQIVLGHNSRGYLLRGPRPALPRNPIQSPVVSDQRKPRSAIIGIRAA